MSFPLLNINYFLTIIVILTRTLEGSLQARRCRVFAHWKPTICYRINKIKTLIKMERQFCRLFADQYHSTVTGSSSLLIFFFSFIFLFHFMHVLLLLFTYLYVCSVCRVLNAVVKAWPSKASHLAVHIQACMVFSSQRSIKWTTWIFFIVGVPCAISLMVVQYI